MTGRKGTYANLDNIQTLKQTRSCKVTQDTLLLNNDLHSVYCLLFLWLLLRHSLLFLNAMAFLLRIRFPEVGFSCCNNSQRWRKQDRRVLPIGPYAARVGQCLCPLLCFSHYVRQNQRRPFTTLRYVSFCAFRFTSTNVVSPWNKVRLTYGAKSCGTGRCKLCRLESTRGA